MNITTVEASLTSTRSSSLSGSRRRRAKPGNQPDRLKRRDVEFMHQTVSVVKKIGEFNVSYLYSATDDDSKKRRTSKNLWIKATAAGTTEEARRAESEVRLLRRLSEAPGIPKMIDCGFSTIEERVYNYGTPDGDQLDVRRLYCILFEACPDYFVSDFIKKRRRKYDSRRTRGLFVRRKKEEEMWEGYLPVDTVLDIFEQMAAAVSALHNLQDNNDPQQSENREGIVHLDIQPARFLIRKVREKGEVDDKYHVSLGCFGCSIKGSMPLRTESERAIAVKCIEASTTAMYRAPEMISLQMTNELNTSADIWGLGCCLYALLFLTDCFKAHSKVDVLRGVFLLPAKHPYHSDVIELLARMLTVNPNQRASIDEVLRCVDCLKSGTRLPPRNRTHQESELDRDRGTDGGSQIFDRQIYHTGTQSDSRIQLGSHSESTATNTDGPTTEGDTTDSQLEQQSNDQWDFAPGEISSDGTEVSQWLEFQPDSTDGSNLRQRTEPLSPPKVTQRRSLRRRRRRTDPLSLGSAQDDKKLFRDWTLGLINQLSSRSLVPIEDGSADADSGSRDGAITRLREPSMRRIRPFAQASRKLPSGPPPTRNPYGSGLTLDSGPSLRVSDLIGDSVPRGVSTSSSEMHAHTSSEFQSSQEMPSSSELGVDFFSDMSSNVTQTPMYDKSHKSIQGPQSAPQASRMSMLRAGISPNMPLSLPYQAKTEMISPRRPASPFDGIDDLPRKPSMAGRQFSDSELVAMKKSKTKKNRKKKDKSSKDKSTKKKRKSRSKSHTIEKGVQDDLASAYTSRHIELKGSTQNINTFSIPDFDPDGGTGTGTGTEDEDVKNPSLFRPPTWSEDTHRDWVGGRAGEIQKKRKKRKSMKKYKSEPSRSLRPNDVDAKVLEEFANSAPTMSASGAWDLKAAEHWVNTKSQDASEVDSQSGMPPNITQEVTRAKDSYHMKRVENPESPRAPEVPQDFVSDAREWIKKKSAIKATQTSQLKQEMKTDLGNRSKRGSELDSVSNLSRSNRSRSNRSHSTRSRESKTFVEVPTLPSASIASRDVEQTWLTSPVSPGVSLISAGLTDEAGFPLPETRFEDPVSCKRDDHFESLKGPFSTPQYKRPILTVPRSAPSLSYDGDASKERKRISGSSSRRRAISREETKLDSSRHEQEQSLNSGKSVRSSPSNKTRSVDSNLPPGDVVVVAEISLPPADSVERERSSLSFKQEVHMALTAEGRQMRRSIKKMEQEPPHDLLARMLAEQSDPNMMTPHARSRPATPEKRREERMFKSSGNMSIPAVIELFEGDNEDSRVGAPMSPSRRIGESLIDEEPRTPSRKVKKKKKSKSKSKERDRVRKTRSEYVGRSHGHDSQAAALSKSVPTMGDLEESFSIQDLIEAERVASFLKKTQVSTGS